MFVAADRGAKFQVFNPSPRIRVRRSPGSALEFYCMLDGCKTDWPCSYQSLSHARSEVTHRGGERSLRVIELDSIL